MEVPFSREEVVFPLPKYEYFDHREDVVQLHGWGDSLKEAFEQCAIAMFNYTTDFEYVQIKRSLELQVNGHNLESLLFRFLDDLLCLLSCEPFFIFTVVTITEFICEGVEFKIKCKCYGEEFTLGKHTQGGQLKAITYSAMQIVNEPNNKRFEVFVTIDI